MEFLKIKGVLMRRIESCLAFPGFKINGNIYCNFFWKLFNFYSKSFLMFHLDYEIVEEDLNLNGVLLTRLKAFGLTCHPQQTVHSYTI
jgi:hypothetical protein